MASVFDLASFGNSGGATATGATTSKNAGAAIVDIGTSIFGIKGAETAAKDEDALLQQQEQMAETTFYQQGLQRARRLRQVMAQATVEEAARGVSVASPSFKGVQRSSFEKFREDSDAAALNLSFEKEQIEARRQQVRDKEKAKKAGFFGKIAGDIVSLI